MEVGIVDNDLETFKILYNPLASGAMVIVEYIIKKNKLDFLEYVYLIDPCKVQILRIACLLGSYSAYMRLIGIGAIPNVTTLLYASVGDNIEILNHMNNLSLVNQLLNDERLAKHAIRYAFMARSMISLSFFIEKEFPMILDDILSTIDEREDTIEFIPYMKYIHNRGYKYEWGCPHCIYCNENKRDILQEDWDMESEFYNSFLQWLPRETLEETLSLL